MALTIIYKNEAENHYITSFEGDSGYYWYWWSWNEHMGNEIGIIVDLYDNSEFDRSNINHFRRLFMDAKNDLIKRPPEFEVITGWKDKVGGSPIKVKINKNQMDKIIDAILDYADRVNSNGGKILCLGD
ncbi:MAG: hypothetical protein K0U86_02065 [Planctomycetes bacterium]|nr:hypothetical protein [Planctomycetota bacterium]MCH9723673.1 hypothetical protein [Planctomycetota bacterium]MCH9778491.1 hypothetical protein [Planctomycetota bacterium]MCH9791571.1 hypothetical protein [Planctomycetota bacterium]